MPATLSVIIPTLNAGEELPETANALLSGVGDGLIRELIVTDGGSSDDTLEIARELGAVIVEGTAGRGQQLWRGVQASQCDWLLLLHADSWLDKGWVTQALDHMNIHPDKAGWFRLRFRATGLGPFILAAGANMRSMLLGLPYGDQGLLISRALLDEIGGIPQIPLMEDVALARSLKGKLRSLDCAIYTSARRYEQGGWIRQPLRNLMTLVRYLLGTSPETLATRYHKKHTD